jgi:hypothetical protein
MQTQHTNRNGTVDCLRFAAAAGIVAFHLQLPGDVIGLAALNFFTILLVHFAVTKSKVSGPDALTKQAKRLLGPWLFWCAIYGIAKASDWWLHGGQEFSFWMVLTGPSIHLWWLPFAFVAVAVAQRSDFYLATFAVLVWALGRLHSGPPFDQWDFVLSSVIYGRALCQDWKWRIPAMALCLIMTGSTQFAIAAIAVHLAMAMPTPSTTISKLLDQSALAIYLSAPLIASVASRVLQVDQSTLTIALLCIGLPLAYTTGVRLYRQDWRVPASSELIR